MFKNNFFKFRNIEYELNIRDLYKSNKTINKYTYFIIIQMFIKDFYTIMSFWY